MGNLEGAGREREGGKALGAHFVIISLKRRVALPLDVRTATRYDVRSLREEINYRQEQSRATNKKVLMINSNCKSRALHYGAMLRVLVAQLNN